MQLDVERSEMVIPEALAALRNHARKRAALSALRSSRAQHRVLSLSARRSRGERVGMQRVIEHAARELALAHDDTVGAASLQIFDFLVGVGAREDVERRIGAARLLHDLPGLKAIGDG